MNHFGVLVMMLLLLAIATPALVANPSANASQHVALAEPASSATTTLATIGNDKTTTPRPASKERSRRPARIDLTMPYYRFGRLPIRVKD